MARDAIARQYDVEKNSIKLDIPGGFITFRAKKGKSIDLDRLHESLQATRLSGRTGMEVRYLELTARGKVVTTGQALRLEIEGAGQEFTLDGGDSARPGNGNTLQRLREALGRGEKVVSVTGRVQGWSGLFPDLLRTYGQQRSAAIGKPGARKPLVLIVTGFRTGEDR